MDHLCSCRKICDCICRPQELPRSGNWGFRRLQVYPRHPSSRSRLPTQRWIPHGSRIPHPRPKHIRNSTKCSDPSTKDRHKTYQTPRSDPQGHPTSRAVLKTITKFENDLIIELQLTDESFTEEEKSDLLLSQEDVIATVREDSKLEFSETLYTLWKLAFDDSRIEPVRCLPITDERRKIFLYHLSFTGYSINPFPHPTHPQSHPQTAEAWEWEISRKERNDEEKTDKSKKIWDNLSDIQRKTILLAGTSEDLFPPLQPTPILMVLLGSGTGARVQTILHHELQAKNCIVHLDSGLCVGIKNRLFLSQPTESSINYYSIIFTPPELHLRGATNDDSGLLISGQAALGNISKEEIAAMTKQVAS